MQRIVLGRPFCAFGRRPLRISSLTVRKATKDEERTSRESQQTQEQPNLPTEDNAREAAAKIRKTSDQGQAAPNIIQGVLEEVGLISWPTPLQAITDTASVVALVALLAVTLFAFNTGLNEASKVYYSFAKEAVGK